ncbi:hypothetical protein [Pseudonocardia sp. T1-2H]|uniref:hypothetical protein n=1 Tax=Pseudonocardia sp. T1-2H TaxID=3128899 RepID=UPI0031019DB6
MLPTRRPLGSARARKILVASAAAAAVVLLPTACTAASAATAVDEKSQQSHSHRKQDGPQDGTQNGNRDGNRDGNQNGATRTAAPAAPTGDNGSGSSGGSGAAGAGASTDASPAPAADKSGNRSGNQSGNQTGNQTGDQTGSEPGSAVPVEDAAPKAKNPEAAAPPPAGGTNGLDVLARDCSKSKLTPADGFEKGNVCVDTAFGEVGAAAKNPSLLITDAPQEVKTGQAFELKVSTRNLVRDRFLGAAAGGYYLESSLLNGQGIQRGHFHTACRMLSSENEAPDPSPKPDFFVATQDGGGGDTPDTVTIKVTGMPSAGVAQCSSWAGDGSHRIPMMERANETPAFDSVRVAVK